MDLRRDQRHHLFRLEIAIDERVSLLSFLLPLVPRGSEERRTRDTRALAERDGK